MSRADATRNREAILTAAREAFADGAADVSMAEIARRSGVGSATLYRNFANRPALLEALYVDEIDAFCNAPVASFEEWLRRFVAYFTGKRLIAEELLAASSPEAAVFGSGRARVLDSGRPLLEAARAAGEVRDDLSFEQILDLVAAIARIPGDESYREPILDAALDALRPRRSGR